MPDRLATRPAEPFADVKGRIAAAVEAARDEIVDLSHRIHAAPEPAFEEHKASAWVVDALRAHGFNVEHPAGSLATAVRAVRSGGRGAGPHIGILAEYDALPGLGHGCGHNTMAASGVGAAIALAAVAGELPGEIVFLGTPAEERGSGKQVMIDDGLFAGIDAALLFHPCDRSHVETYPMTSEDVDVVFTGVAAHAASDPWKGRNALDAMIQLFTSVGLWRQQVRPTTRVHGIIREGGTAANIIPDRTVGLVHAAERRSGLLRGDQGAVRPDVPRPPPWRRARRSRSPIPGSRRRCATTGVLAERFRANMAAYGVDDMGDDPNAGSTDMANVSWVCPAIHPDLADLRRGRARPLDRRSATRRRRRAPTRRRCSPRRSSPRPPWSCSPTRRSSRPPGRSSAPAERSEPATATPEPVLPSGAARPAGRSDLEPAAPRARRTIPTAAGTAPASVSGGPRGRAPPRPRLRGPTSPRERLGCDVRDLRATSTCPRTSARPPS